MRNLAKILVFLLAGISLYLLAANNKVEYKISPTAMSASTEQLQKGLSLTEATSSSLGNPVIAAATSTALKKTAASAGFPPKKPVSGHSVDSKISEAVPPLTAPDIPDWQSINENARASVVNILCTTPSGGLTYPLSGSGVLIDPRGVILTNAHIGEYFLLKDYIDCEIRIGSPARPAYRARLVYISPSWLAGNNQDILLQSPAGTGQFDFALLLITSSTGPSVKMPDRFPFLKLDYNNLTSAVNQPILLVAYPAGFLGGSTIQTNLNQNTAPSTLTDVSGLSTSTADLLSLGGSIVAQKGSSGGAVVGPNGKLWGIIAASTQGQTTSERELLAISIAHINDTITKETGYSLEAILKSDVKATADSFDQNLAPALTKLLTDNINKLKP